MPWWLDLVERGVAAYNSRDAEAFAAICTPDAELSPLVVQAEGGEPYRGDAGVRRWFEEIEAAFESVHIEAERVHDLGEALVMEVRLRNRGRASGAEIALDLVQAVTLRDRAVARLSIHRDRDVAARALGFPSLNVALVMRHHQAWLAHDYEGAVAMMDPDLEWDTRQGFPDGAADRGIEAATAFTRRWFETWEDWRFEPLEYLDAGSEVLVRCRLEGRGKASGARVVSEVVQLWSFDDNARAVCFRAFQDEAAARTAAGLPSRQPAEEEA